MLIHILRGMIRRHTFWLALLVAGATGLLLFQPVQAANPSTINFQGKVVNADGTNVANGTYTFVFRLYDAASPTTTSSCSANSSCWWEETDSLTVTNGVFQVELGSVCAFTSACNSSHSGIDFNVNGALYLTFKFNNDAAGFMSPTVHLTSVPYAFNSDKVDGLDATAFGQLASTQTWTGANLFSNTGTAAFKVQNASNFGVFNVDSSTNHVKVYDGTATQGNVDISYSDGSSSGIIAASAALVLNSTGANAITVDSTTTGAVNVATGSNAKTVTIGNQTGATALNLKSGTGNINLQPVASGDVIFSEAVGSNMQLTATAPPTVDQLAISNAGQGVTTGGINGLSVNFVGGAAAVESSGERIDVTPGTTSGGTWNGLRIVANATGAASGVTLSGIKLEGPTSQGSGQEYGITIGDGWDSGLNIAAETTNPSPPAADTLDLYVKDVDGRAMLKGMGSSGVDYAYQPSLFQQSIFLCTQSTTTAVTGQGGPCTAVDNSANAVTTTENTGVAVQFRTSAVSGNAAGVWQTVSNYFRGTVTNGSNGFFYFTRFYLSDASYGSGSTGTRIFAGLSNQTTSTTMTGSDNPAGNYAGIQYSTARGDTNWMCTTKDNTTQTTASTGVAFAPLKQYDVYVYTPPLGTTVYMRVDNNTDGTTGECSSTTHLPAAGTALRPEVFLATLTGTARNIDFQRMYVETDR